MFISGAKIQAKMGKNQDTRLKNIDKMGGISGTEFAVYKYEKI